MIDVGLLWLDVVALGSAYLFGWTAGAVFGLLFAGHGLPVALPRKRPMRERPVLAPLPRTGGVSRMR